MHAESRARNISRCCVSDYTRQFHCNKKVSVCATSQRFMLSLSRHRELALTAMGVHYSGLEGQLLGVTLQVCVCMLEGGGAMRVGLRTHICDHACD